MRQPSRAQMLADSGGSAAEEPMVRRLTAGGKRIRTIGPARRKAVVPKREHPRAASRSLPGRPANDIGADERQAAGDQIIATRLRRSELQVRPVG